MRRTLIIALSLVALTGCANCLPGQSKLDKGMVAQTQSSQWAAGPGESAQP